MKFNDKTGSALCTRKLISRITGNAIESVTMNSRIFTHFSRDSFFCVKGVVVKRFESFISV